MLIEKAENQREGIVAILAAEKLPVDDLPENVENFLVAKDKGELVGVIGLELYGDYRLLRSFAAVSAHRN